MPHSTFDAPLDMNAYTKGTPPADMVNAAGLAFGPDFVLTHNAATRIDEVSLAAPAGGGGIGREHVRVNDSGDITLSPDKDLEVIANGGNVQLNLIVPAGCDLIKVQLIKRNTGFLRILSTRPDGTSRLFDGQATFDCPGLSEVLYTPDDDNFVIVE